MYGQRGHSEEKRIAEGASAHLHITVVSENHIPAFVVGDDAVTLVHLWIHTTRVAHVPAFLGRHEARYEWTCAVFGDVHFTDGAFIGAVAVACPLLCVGGGAVMPR